MSYSLSTENPALARQRSVINQVYLWMTLGLLVTAGVAAFTASSPLMLAFVFGNTLVLFALFFFQIMLVVALSAAIQRMSVGTAMLCFLLYAALNGLTLSGIFLEYTHASLASTFLVTAGTFAGMSLYGYSTKTDLTAVRNIAFMGLLGVILATLVNIFLRSALVYWITTYIGIAIFVALVAADTQKLKQWIAMSDSDASRARLALIGALMLYLDFINLFLYLLRIFGRTRNQ